MKYFLFVALCFFSLSPYAQSVSKSFELRVFTDDPKANGETDFKGEKEWMDTEKRIRFLDDYAHYASRFFGNPGLDKKIVSREELSDLLVKLKPQPATSVRETVSLDSWKAYGYREGQETEKQENLKLWSSCPGVTLRNGHLVIENATITRKIDSLTWRFKVEVSVKVSDARTCLINLFDGSKKAISFGMKNNKIVFGTGGETKMYQNSSKGDWIKLTVETDFTQKKYNLYADDKCIGYYIPMLDTSAAVINQFSISSDGYSQLDNIFIFNHTPTGKVRYPYVSSIVINEDFNAKPGVNGWQSAAFDDSGWEEVTLPSVHGGLCEKGEAYYLRRKINIGNFERATLKFETIDPGGEIWINGQVVSVINSRHPVELDVTKYIVKKGENLIAVKVDPYQLQNPMAHTPTDHYIGWFAGMAKLLLSDKCMIKDVFVHTESISDPATQSHKILINNKEKYYFEGNLEINYYPWFPDEGEKLSSYSQKVQVRPGIVNEYEIKVPVYSPKLWSSNSPFLYKVEVILKDNKGNPVDDYVSTTGIRTVGQKNGDFYFNEKQEMLNGAQIMGFRTPIETVSKTNRCAPVTIIAEELLSIKKMGGNLLRIHVHAEQDTCDGINDPRYAELADQMGIYLIWQTAGWLRGGEAWHVDFDGYPKYMRQVYNHPSIVMWEAGNHPNMFKTHDISDTHDYISKIYNTIYPVDQSRLISPTTFWQHTYYADYEGTLDYKGNKIHSVPEYMEELVTRGSQDAYAGYGHKWSTIRTAPYSFALSCLAAKDKAYFNFEHEESIGQPNWELCKGKPWYLLQSYEWGYDEGSIGEKLSPEKWRASQAWQAFSAWESMKKQILLGYDGFSWCCLHGGANMGTYKKPLIDCLGHPKLAFYTNKMVFQPTWAGSNNVDVVYGPDDKIKPVINHLGNSGRAELVVRLITLDGKLIQEKKFENIELKEGHSTSEQDAFRFTGVKEGVYAIDYEVTIKN